MISCGKQGSTQQNSEGFLSDAYENQNGEIAVQVDRPLEMVADHNNENNDAAGVLDSDDLNEDVLGNHNYSVAGAGDEASGSAHASAQVFAPGHDPEGGEQSSSQMNFVMNNEPFLTEEMLNGIYGLLRLNSADMFDEVNLKDSEWKTEIDAIMKKRLEFYHKKLEVLSSIYHDNIPTNQMHHIEKIMSIFKSKEKEIYISKIPKMPQYCSNCEDHGENHSHARPQAEQTSQIHPQPSQEHNGQDGEEASAFFPPHEGSPEQNESQHEMNEQSEKEREGTIDNDDVSTSVVDDDEITDEEAELRMLKNKLEENQKIRLEQEDQRRELIAQNQKLKQEYNEMLEKNRRLREDFNNRVSIENTFLRREVMAEQIVQEEVNNEAQNQVQAAQAELSASQLNERGHSHDRHAHDHNNDQSKMNEGVGQRIRLPGISMHDVQSIMSMEFVDLKKCRQMDPVDNSITFDLNDNYSIRIKSCEQMKYDKSSMCANVPHFIFQDNVFPFLSSVELFRIRGVSPEWREMVRDVWHKTFKRDMQEQLLATDLCKEIESQCCLMHIRNPFYQKLNVLLHAMVEVINWEEFEVKAMQNQLTFVEKKIVVALTRVINAPSMQNRLPFSQYDNINEIIESDFQASFNVEVILQLKQMLQAAIEGNNIPSVELKKIHSNFLMSADVSISSMANELDKNTIILALIAKQFFLFALLKNFFTCSSAFLYSAKAKLDSLSRDWPTSKGFLEGAYRILLLRNVTIKNGKIVTKETDEDLTDEKKKERKAARLARQKKKEEEQDVEDLKEKEGQDESIDEDDEDLDEEDEQESENDVARLMKSIFNISKGVNEEPDIVIKRKSTTLKVFLDQGTKLDIILNTAISLGIQNMRAEHNAQIQQTQEERQPEQAQQLHQLKEQSSKQTQFDMDQVDEPKRGPSIEELEEKFKQNQDHIDSMKRKSQQIQVSLEEQKIRLEAIAKKCETQMEQFR